MPILQNDVVRVVARMERDGSEDVINVYHLMNGSAISVTDAGFMSAVATVLDNAYGQFAHALSTDLEFVEIEGYNVTRDTWLGSVSWPTQTFGTNVAEELPYQVAALVTFKTATTQHPGKKYLGGFTEDTNAGDGILTSGLLTELAAYAAVLLNGVTVEGAEFMFGNYNYALTRWAIWIAGAVDALWSTQRRRKTGIGS